VKNKILLNGAYLAFNKNKKKSLTKNLSNFLNF
jgi:hypothetical protein